MKKDLVVLVSDKDMEAAIGTLLRERREALGIREVQADIFVHPERDPGILRKAHIFLQAYCKDYRYALVLFDHEGCGQETRLPDELQSEVKSSLEKTGWTNRCDVIVLVPELEMWVWSDSPHVPQVLGVSEKEMQDILKGFPRKDSQTNKPSRPKEAMEDCLRRGRVPRSSSLYAKLAAKVSVQRCSDPAFVQLRSVLQQWFHT